MSEPEQAVIDRFEGDTAVCVSEDGSVFTLPCEALPEAAREGSHILRGEDGLWQADEAATSAGKAALKKRMDALWAD